MVSGWNRCTVGVAAKFDEKKYSTVLPGYSSSQDLQLFTGPPEATPVVPGLLLGQYVALPPVRIQRRSSRVADGTPSPSSTCSPLLTRAPAPKRSTSVSLIRS